MGIQGQGLVLHQGRCIYCTAGILPVHSSPKLHIFRNHDVRAGFGKGRADYGIVLCLKAVLKGDLHGKTACGGVIGIKGTRCLIVYSHHQRLSRKKSGKANALDSGLGSAIVTLRVNRYIGKLNLFFGYGNAGLLIRRGSQHIVIRCPILKQTDRHAHLGGIGHIRAVKGCTADPVIPIQGKGLCRKAVAKGNGRNLCMDGTVIGLGRNRCCRNGNFPSADGKGQSITYTFRMGTVCLYPHSYPVGTCILRC